MPTQDSTRERFVVEVPTSVRLAGVDIASLVVLLRAAFARMVVGLAQASASETGASNTDTVDFIAIDSYAQKEMAGTPEARFRKEERR